MHRVWHFAQPPQIDGQELRRVNLEVAYERMPGVRLLDAFARAANLMPGEWEAKLEIYPHEIDHKWASVNIPSNARERTIAVAPGPGLWAGRNWSRDNWSKLTRALLSLNYRVLLFGTDKQYQLPCSQDFRNRTNYHSLAAMLARCAAFVGIDSFPAHVAGAVGCPRVVLFGITTARLILCDSQPTIAVESDPKHPYTGARPAFCECQHLNTGGQMNCGRPDCEHRQKCMTNGPMCVGVDPATDSGDHAAVAALSGDGVMQFMTDPDTSGSLKHFHEIVPRINAVPDQGETKLRVVDASSAWAGNPPTGYARTALAAAGEEAFRKDVLSALRNIADLLETIKDRI